MKILPFLLLVFLAFSCKNETSNTSPNAAGTAQETDPAASEYGIPGADKARITEGQESTEYVYRQYKVTTVADADKAGENIAVFSSDGQEIWKLGNSDGGNFFFGLSSDYLLVDKGTGPDGRAILVHDLKNNKTVLEVNYIGDMQISTGGVLAFYRKAPDRVADMTSCSQKETWEKEGLRVGYGQLHEYTLATGQISGKPGFKCFPLQ